MSLQRLNYSRSVCPNCCRRSRIASTNAVITHKPHISKAPFIFTINICIEFEFLPLSLIAAVPLRPCFLRTVRYRVHWRRYIIPPVERTSDRMSFIAFFERAAIKILCGPGYFLQLFCLILRRCS